MKVQIVIKIFSDSTSDLSDELVKKYGITIVPLHISLGEKEYRDRVEISPDQIYEWCEEHETTPKTSAVSIEDACEQMKPVLDNGDEIIAFAISSQMSTTGNVFRLAADELNASDAVTVIDSKNLSTGIGLLVICAAVMADNGNDRETITNYINGLIPRVRASFVVDTLIYLHRGGRCSSVAALAGGVLKLHPKIVVENGTMTATKKYRGKMNAVISKYVEDMKDDLLHAMPNRVFITHSGCDQKIIDQIYEYLEKLNYFDEILITRAGGVISSHCGPGTLGVLFIAREEQ